MKKIIATAVATAFVAPVMAADVSLHGDVEYSFVSTGGVSSSGINDSDITVKASEELGNGMSAEIYLTNASNASTFVSALSISGDFGTFEFGNDNDVAAKMFEDKHDVAERNAGDELGLGLDALGAIASYKVSPVEGLTVAVSYAAETGTDLTADVNSKAITDTRTDTAYDNETLTSFGAQYKIGGFTIGGGTVSVDTADTAYEDPTVYSASFSQGPYYVGYSKVNNNEGDADATITGVGATYDYGSGKVFYENVSATKSDSAKYEETAFGVSYKMAGVNLYVENMDKTDEGSKADTTTTFGVEYSF